MLIYLVMTSWIFAGSSAYCFLLYARRYLAIMLSFRPFCRRLIANFTDVDLVEMFDMLGERSCGGGWGMKMRMSQEEYLSIVENYAIAIYLFVCFVGIHI